MFSVLLRKLGSGVNWENFSLAEAQRMTTVFAKLEYNFKRLLWLGS